MELKRQMDPQKRKIVQIITGIGLFLFFAALAWFILSYAQKSSRDALRLADIKALRLELEMFYHKYNKFPGRIILKKSAADIDACLNDLCLEQVPADPLSGAAYNYTPCADNEHMDCNVDIPYPKSYFLIYKLETGAAGLPASPHYADPTGICSDDACLAGK